MTSKFALLVLINLLGFPERPAVAGTRPIKSRRVSSITLKPDGRLSGLSIVALADARLIICTVISWENVRKCQLWVEKEGTLGSGKWCRGDGGREGGRVGGRED